jgi:type VI secretion system protein ImpI
VLKLQIENLERLPDGGPISYQADRRGFDFGRDHHLDWTLPDESRFISGKHCEVRYYDGAYWLYDISTNGTFVNKSTRRVQSPYKLADGDELLIGDYIIRVMLTAEASGASLSPVAPQPQAPPAPATDLWVSHGMAPAPIAPHELLPPVQRGSRAGDFLSSAANISQPAYRPVPAPVNVPQPVPATANVHDPWAPTGLGGIARPIPATREQREQSFPAMPEFRPHAAAQAAMAAPPLPPSQEPLARSEIERELLRQFALGAGIAEDIVSHRGAGELSFELGQLLRIVCSNLMQLLSARASAKTLARSGQRTLIQPHDNNPLKFTPSVEEAIRIMLSTRSESYLDSRQTLELSFADLKSHQIATLSAMQTAISELLADISPEAIEKTGAKNKSSLLGTTKGTLWDVYKEIWSAKAAHHENGILDEFNRLFGQFYERELKKSRYTNSP